MFLVFLRSQLVVLDKNSWFIVVAAWSAGGLDCIMSNSTILALSFGIEFSAQRGGDMREGRRGIWGRNNNVLL